MGVLSKLTVEFTSNNLLAVIYWHFVGMFMSFFLVKLINLDFKLHTKSRYYLLVISMPAFMMLFTFHGWSVAVAMIAAIIYYKVFPKEV